ANVMREGRPRDKKLFGRLLTRAGQWMSRAPGRPSPRQQLEDDLSTAWMWQTVLLFQIPTVPWQNLLRRFEALVKNFPRSPHLAQAQKYAVTLKQMLRDDEEHAKVAQATDGPSRQQQIQELIFQLRNQNGVQREQPGGCDIFADPRGEASSAHQLLKLSMESLPELIRAFDQTSLTRSVGYQRDSVFSHRVLTVGECAKIIVQTMFGRSFPAPDDSVGNPGEMATTWWNEAREKGLTRLLVEAVEQGKEGSARQAELLFATDPAALAAALPMGFDRALEPWVKRDLVQIAARIPGEEIIPFLQQRLQSRNLQWAVMAAWGLHKRGDPNVVATMIQRWKAKLSDGQDGEEGVDHLIAFLVASSDENAISALASDLPQRSATLRRKVIETLADGALPFWLDLHYPGLWSEQMKKKLSPRTFEILEQLLVSSLEDTAEGNWTIIGPNGKSMQNPRVCDYAGKLLAEQWKPKYQFDFWASQADRDRQRLECINIWRKENAMPMG
ncbi:MAG: hypothetical protein JWM16_2873, partial [Verrucomicrobiales bacterium]|nr:hypothetical protein [Verrucomicrobiales bacterium]